MALCPIECMRETLVVLIAQKSCILWVLSLSDQPITGVCSRKFFYLKTVMSKLGSVFNRNNAFHHEFYNRAVFHHGWIGSVNIACILLIVPDVGYLLH